jgi:transcriptional regulator with XRE-family HTH domain
MPPVSRGLDYDFGFMAGRPPTKEAPPFGQRLAALRKRHGLSQTQLAQLIGSTLKAVDYYERRAQNPTAEIVEKIASVFSVTSDELLGRKPLREAKPGPVSKVQQRLDQIANLPREKQKVVLQLLDSFLQTSGATANGH